MSAGPFSSTVSQLTERSAQQVVRIQYLTDQSEQQAAQNRRLLAQVSELKARQEGESGALEARLTTREHAQAALNASRDAAEASSRCSRR